MGNMSIILVLAAILSAGTALFTMQRTSLATDTALSTQQFEYLAREAAFAGMEIEMREAVLQVDVSLNPTWTGVNFAGTEKPYNGGTYKVTGTPGSCSRTVNDLSTLSGAPFFLASNNQLLEVTATGKYSVSDENVYHEVVTCFVVVDASSAVPPAFKYAFVSNQHLNFNSNIDIIAYLDGMGSIHSNSSLYLGSNVTIDGHVTMVDINHKDTDNKADPSQIGSWGPGDSVPLKPFDPAEYNTNPNPFIGLSGASMSGNNVTVDNTARIGGPHCTLEAVCDYYLPGHLLVKGHLIVEGFTRIVIAGELNVQGNASVTADGTLPPDKATETQLKEWIDRQLADDGKTKTAFYVNGVVDIGGGAQMVGTIYTNGDFRLGGGGSGTNLVGSVAAVGSMDTKGGGKGGNFWYAPITEQIVLPGVIVPENIITVAGASEWRNAVIKHSSSSVAK
jgi:hypothetical protein